MTKITFETLIYCLDCGEDLTVEVGKVLTAEHGITPCIRVSPCQQCIKAAKEEVEAKLVQNGLL